MFCQKCGENLQKDVQFCPKCGTSVSMVINKTSSNPKGRDNAIWNPNAASNQSIIFSPAFGSYLHALNQHTLGEQDKYRSSMGWFYFSLSIPVVYILMDIFIADEKLVGSLGRGLAFLNLIIWYYVAGRAQAKYVKEKFGKDYPRRGWGKPLLIDVGAIITYLLLAMAISTL